MNKTIWSSSALTRTLAAAATGSAIASTLRGSVVYADEGRPKKLSIYDEEQPEIILVEHPTRVEHGVAYTKKFLNETHAEGRTQLQNLTDQWIKLEQTIETTVNETIAPGEKALPGLIYVGVGALAGTIVARNRGFFLRVTAPILFAAAASNYFLPKTTRNVFLHLHRLEQQSPTLVSAHQSISDAARQARGQIDETVSQLRRAVPGGQEEKPETGGKAKREVEAAVERIEKAVKETVGGKDKK
ncbi:apolipo protein O-domain-containing protein [Jimgerdemannia flammicorona]|uniref:MICOS complex subunit n=2 Tax=Jimgerdemannia flammicorona TaxID=994334 RepID=A0A433B4N2_9FUNG|nr:apolipo protein O-domain-containing protein [Jimgerdemannia flammicorona]RUS25165.1 apolipo protein O-domain-containing protein [Jimgerdemannia flammicorona]